MCCWFKRSVPIGRGSFCGPAEQAFKKIRLPRLLAFEGEFGPCRPLLDFDRTLPRPGVFDRPGPALGVVAFAPYPALGAALLTIGAALLAGRHLSVGFSLFDLLRRISPPRRLLRVPFRLLWRLRLPFNLSFSLPFSLPWQLDLTDRFGGLCRLRSRGLGGRFCFRNRGCFCSGFLLRGGLNLRGRLRGRLGGRRCFGAGHRNRLC